MVDMKGKGDVIDEKTADLQLATAVRIVEILEQRPGVILGDDVGMGKTYMAIATIYYYLSQNPGKPVLIVAPSWMMQKKWVDDIKRFVEVNDRQGLLSEADIFHVEKNGTVENIRQFISGAYNKQVVVVPIDIFTSGGWKHEKAFYLNCWFRKRSLSYATRGRIMEKVLGDPALVEDPLRITDKWTRYYDIPEDCYEELDRAYDDNDMSQVRINTGLDQLRYKALNARLPGFSLFILDEAHKVKNPSTKRHQALLTMLANRYDRGLFLTATPFQLSEGELFAVLELFKNSAVGEAARQEFSADCDRLKSAIKEYKASISYFENAWHHLQPDETASFIKAVENDNRDVASVDVEEALRLYEDVLSKKENLQEIMSRFVIRNTRNKSKYRKEVLGKMNDNNKAGIPIGEDHYIPFALWEKTIYELFKTKDRTFIPTVKQSMTSTYEALKASSLYQRDNLAALNTIKKILPERSKHPKLEELAANIAEALEKNEKTLVFCGRVESARAIKERLERYYERKQKRSIESLFPENPEQSFANYQRRFTNKQDSAWYYLQENYIQTVLDVVLPGKRLGIAGEQIADEVSALYAQYNRSKKTNMMYLKRIVEQVVFKRAIDKHQVNWNNLAPSMRATIKNILDPRYIELGLNMKEDETERDEGEESSSGVKSISYEVINRLIEYKGIWTRYRDILNKLQPEDREDVVDGLKKFLQRDKSFFITLKKLEVKKPWQKRTKLIPEAFFKGADFNWDSATQRFLENYANAPTKVDKENMLYGLRESSIVDILYGGVAENSREKMKEGFNTPFYPMVLITLPLAQEGIDLQKECRRVVHYDLEWNPASLEQRVGRIDRINSLVSRLNRDSGPGTKLEIYYPYIQDTVDESILRTVKQRERWFSFILGGTPDWESFSIDEDHRLLPENICKSLQLDLSVFNRLPG
jgi:SNF2 family DNA or RNA helicase